MNVVRMIKWLPDRFLSAILKVKSYFVNLLNQKRIKRIVRDNEQIRQEFDVEERDGSLWLTHQGIAFLKVSSLANAHDVAMELNKVREYAIEFKSLWK